MGVIDFQKPVSQRVGRRLWAHTASMAAVITSQRHLRGPEWTHDEQAVRKMHQHRTGPWLSSVRMDVYQPKNHGLL